MQKLSGANFILALISYFFSIAVDTNIQFVFLRDFMNSLQQIFFPGQFAKHTIEIIDISQQDPFMTIKCKQQYFDVRIPVFNYR